MSRIGRMPISLPSNVEVTLGEGNLVTVKGPKGTLTQKLSDKMTITKEENVIHVTRPNDAKENRALHGLTHTLGLRPQAEEGEDALGPRRQGEAAVAEGGEDHVLLI